MGLTYAQLLPSSLEPWTVVGPPDATTVALHADLTVNYSGGSTDTIPAGTVSSSVDRSTDVWVVYTVPASLALSLAKESLLSGLTGDWCPLARLVFEAIQPYQPVTPSSGGGAAISFVINGGGAAIVTGLQGSLVVPYDCTIQSVTLLADTSTSTVLDIQRDTYSTYPSATSIVAAAPPTITAAQKSQDSTLTGWTTALTAGDILQWSVSSNDNATELTCVLLVTR